MMTRPGIDEIELVPLCSVGEAAIVELMNQDAVRTHLPLLSGPFTAEVCRAFVEAKRRLWEAHGFGPWAIVIGGEFAGWGGLQPEQGEADFALVLHPRFWGWGRRIFVRIRDDAFHRLGLTSITALLPPSRVNARVVTRLGFVDDGELTLYGERFLRFRLANTAPCPDTPAA